VTLALASVHLSVLEVAHGAGLACVLLLIHRDGRVRPAWADLGALAVGGLLSLALSPWALHLVHPRSALPLVDLQPGMVTVPSLREYIALCGLPLATGVGTAVLGLGRPGAAGTRRWPLALLLAALVAVTPLALAAGGIQTPLQLYTARLLLAAALFGALLATMVLAALADGPRGIRWTGLIPLLALVVEPLLRGAAQPPRLIAFVALVLVVGAVQRGGARVRLASGAVLVAAAVALRLWIWTPRVPDAVSWLRQHRAATEAVVTNWPATNALDALLAPPILDGLAGRDAGVGLHRSRRLPPLRPDLLWCAGSMEESVVALVEALPAEPTSWIVVDDAFAHAWEVYAHRHAEGAIGDNPAALSFYAEAPCPEPPPARLRRLRAALDADPRFSRVYADDRCTIHRLGGKPATGLPPAGS
jgi:hypothetical protein